MKKFRNPDTGEITFFVDDLSFLYDRCNFSWIQRHVRNVRCRRALKHADRIVAVDAKTAADIVKYYFVPKNRIEVIPPQQESLR